MVTGSIGTKNASISTPFTMAPIKTLQALALRDVELGIIDDNTGGVGT